MSCPSCIYYTEDPQYEMIALPHVLPCFFQSLSSLARTEDTPFDVRQVGSSETKVHGDDIISHQFPVKSDSSKFIDQKNIAQLVWVNFIASDIIYAYIYIIVLYDFLFFNIHMYFLFYINIHVSGPFFHVF